MIPRPTVTDLAAARAAKAERAEAVVRVHPDAYAEATCALPGCGEPLYITWTASRAVYLSDTVTELADPKGAHSTAWQVDCGAGHTVLLPVDDGSDGEPFGACFCEGVPELMADCGHNDLVRLRRVVA